MEFIWNIQENKMADIKELEYEYKIINKEINFYRTDLNYDLVKSNINLYNRIKNRLESTENISKIQKNQIVDFSNIIILPCDEAKKYDIEESKRYFKEIYNYFCNKFGKENIVSAKVYLNVIVPYMHLHLVPINSKGELQTRKMTPNRMNKIYIEASKYLTKKGFNIERLKEKKFQKNISLLKDELKLLTEIKKEINNFDKIEYKKNFIGRKISIKEKDFKDLKNNLISLKKENLKLKSINNKILENFEEIKEKYTIEKENFKKQNFKINQTKHNYILVWNIIKKDLKIRNFVINKIFENIKKENEIERKKIIKENKISEKFSKKFDNVEIKINLKNTNNNLINIFQKEIYLLEEVEKIFETFAFMKTEKIDITIYLETHKKFLNLKNLKMDFENKSLKNQLLKNKNIINQLELEFKSQEKI